MSNGQNIEWRNCRVVEIPNKVGPGYPRSSYSRIPCTASYDHHRTIKYFLDFVTRVQTFCTFDALMDYEMDIESYVTHVCNQLKKNDS
ncbi:hypothetical protein M514_11058 [Trichuris suis]|uniref:Uncharacterized protein n=1 Tax=Trichuris suis TaxID=68888 RepID=A0A085MV51_9BILA|nr:hypothetical protein M514_11058 [Trichuris suis]